MTDDTAVQDSYPDDLAHCYGCGRLNTHGHQIRTYWEKRGAGDETVTRFTPRPEHTAIPGYVYGGLLASLIDCHGTGTAAAAAYRFRNREPGSEPPLRFVTAQLVVDYLKPTPLGVELEIRGRVEEIKEKKVVVSATVFANGEATAKGRIVAVLMPASMAPKVPDHD